MTEATNEVCKPRAIELNESLPEKGRHYLGAIAESVHEMGTLIDDLLDFSRSGQTELRQTDLDMDRVLHEALDPLREGQPDRAIEWAIAPLPPVHGDPAMLRLVWANLLGNAVKYTRTRTLARIEVGAREEGREKVPPEAASGRETPD